MMSPLERLRREQGLDQKELASRAQVAQSTVSRAENGGALSAINALKLARVLGVSVERLLEQEPSPTGEITVEREGFDQTAEGAA